MLMTDFAPQENERNMDLLSDSQKLPARKFFFWGHFRHLISDFGAQVFILGNFHFGSVLVLVLGTL